MKRISIDLPTRHTLHLRLVKKNKNREDKPLLPNLGEIRRIRKGSKLSRFFVRLFEQKTIKKILGTNLAFLVIASSLYQTKPVQAQEAENQTTKAPVVLKTTQSYQYPLKSIKVTQGYSFFHRGVDFDGITGDAIYSVKKGDVISAQYSPYGYGNFVLIDHGSGVITLYAHLSKIYVKKGEHVTPDVQIGEMGATGRASGDHLHLEVYEKGKAINPNNILSYN